MKYGPSAAAMNSTFCPIFVVAFQVITFWEGEIVDTKNYTFFTGKWGATYVLSNDGYSSPIISVVKDK